MLSRQGRLFSVILLQSSFCLKQYKSKVVSHALTVKGKTLVSVILTDIEIGVVGNQSKSTKTRAIWDTGATNSVITKEVVERLGITNTGFAQVNTASEKGIMAGTYLIDIKLKPDLIVGPVQVTQGVILSENGIDCLIGMDIINLGDFSITNFEGQTWMSFRVPSQHKVDFVEKMNNHTAVINRHFALGKNMNHPCSCGSKKTFKNCHGSNLEKV